MVVASRAIHITTARWSVNDAIPVSAPRFVCSGCPKHISYQSSRLPTGVVRTGNEPLGRFPHVYYVKSSNEFLQGSTVVWVSCGVQVCEDAIEVTSNHGRFWDAPK